MRIDSAEARSITDTRGKPTLETVLHAGSLSATASVPSGKSTGSHEAKELRDADGGVSGAITNVNGEIAAAVSSRDFSSADELDEFLVALDGTSDKSRLGANALLSVSIAAARLFAQAEDLPLWKSIAKRAGTTPGAPRLYVNVLNGGVHADFRLPFQEYMLVCEGKTSVALKTAEAAFAELGTRLGKVPMGDEGGYSPSFADLDEPFEVLSDIVSEYPHTFIALDAAATELEQDGAYRILGKPYTAEELTKTYEDLSVRFPLRSIEDPFSEDAHDDFAGLTAAIGKDTVIIGDDFTVTNVERIEHAIRDKAVNAVLIKPNQIGTVREAILAVEKTYSVGWKAVCSHRSGETDDTFIADFAYGVGAYGIKAGGLGQKERLEKYERLVEIEKETLG